MVAIIFFTVHFHYKVAAFPFRYTADKNISSCLFWWRPMQCCNLLCKAPAKKFYYTTRGFGKQQPGIDDFGIVKYQQAVLW